MQIMSERNHTYSLSVPPVSCVLHVYCPAVVDVVLQDASSVSSQCRQCGDPGPPERAGPAV